MSNSFKSPADKFFLNFIEIYISAVLNNDIFRLRDCTAHEFKS